MASQAHKVGYLFIVLWLVFLTACGGSGQSQQHSESQVTPPADTTPLHTYYVATNGDDSNQGTIDKPFKTWKKAWDVVVPGDYVYIRGGTYYPPDITQGSGIELIGKSGLPGNYIRFFAYPGEVPVLDCSVMTSNSSLAGIYFTGDYCYFKGLEIKGVPQSVSPLTNKGNFCRGFAAVDCKFNYFVNLNSHHNGGPAFHLTGNSNHNLVLNSDFHHNYDPNTYDLNSQPYSGGNADGCEIGPIPEGYENTISGCRFWWNSDDGLDLWDNEGMVTIDNCWSFWNGYRPDTFDIAADGNGFKLGRTQINNSDKLLRVVKNCVAYANRKRGFDQNSANTKIAIYNNTAYLNGDLGFQFNNYPIAHVARNNISYANYAGVLPDSHFSTQSDQANNTWNNLLAVTADFVSIDPFGITGVRSSNGSLPYTTFLRLVRISGLIDKGVNVGLPYMGKAPDLGAFEGY